MVMAVFAYIYHQSFISPRNFSADAILDQDLKKPEVRGAEDLV
uniref:Uncharacterized protein n=1 Tax=Aegilops tauschii subsp. strangulata TaxID=200361 RepID=A0A452XKB4_AEGTS